MHTLETERLLLRSWTLNDADDLYDYARHPEVGLRCGWPPHESPKISRSVIADFFIPANDEHSFAIEEKTSGKVIGSIAIKIVKEVFLDLPIPRYEIGYALHPDYWGQGLAGEASRRILTFLFDEYNAEAVYIGHFEENNQSRRVIEKLGFTKLGEDAYFSPLINRHHRCLVYRMEKKMVDGVDIK